MGGGWFYAQEGKAVGPLTFDALIAVVRKMPDARYVKVWHASFEDWQAAKDVPQISSIFEPPPLPTLPSSRDSYFVSAKKKTVNRAREVQSHFS
jgi:GYF domain 2